MWQMLCGVWRVVLEVSELLVTKELVVLGGAGERTATESRGSGEVLASDFTRTSYSG